MSKSYWWNELQVRPVWVEITRRPNDDIGVDLTHHNSSPKAFELLGEPEPGDKVLHWDSKRQQFVGVSTVDTPAYRSKGSRIVTLKNFTGLPKDSLSLEKIRPHGQKISQIRDALSPKNESVYFPLQPYGPSGWDMLRPALAYLTAAPSELVALLGGIYERSLQNNSVAPNWTQLQLGRVTPTSVSKNGKAKDEDFKRYLRANEDLIVTDSGKILSPDRSLLQAAHRQHNALQNKLAKWLQVQGLHPESQRAMDKYPIDIQWRIGSTLYVAEVKSISSSNQSSQIRRGIGQVLHYRFLADRQHENLNVVAALILPRKPDTDWLEVCGDVDILVAWPSAFERLLR
jgi:hypothetical protein